MAQQQHPAMMGLAPASSVFPPPVLELRDIFRIYREQDIETVALRGVTLSVAAGEFMAVVGRSGSGKSTLLGIAAGLTAPSAGKVLIDGQDITRLTEEARAVLRRQRLGIVFQQNNLIPFLSARENIEVVLTDAAANTRRRRALTLLERVGLGKRQQHRPAQLSGGEQQRVAIAVALANDPTLLLADEVTGELDSVTADGIIQLISDLNRERGMAVVLVTHNPTVAARAERIVQMADGLVQPYLPLHDAAPTLATPARDIEVGGTDTVLIQAEHLTKTYAGGVHALRDITFAIHAGESVAVMGPSGCGKSTLLNLLGGLDRPTSGAVSIADETLESLDASALAMLRRRKIGVVFQTHNLLPTLTAAENVAMPLVLDDVPIAARQTRALALLERVGLGAASAKLPDQLSGGQRQRVALARSLAHHPAVLLADEPTGNLDSENAMDITQLLVKLTREEGLALLLVTHDPLVAAHCQRIIQMKDGRQTTADHEGDQQ